MAFIFESKVVVPVFGFSRLAGKQKENVEDEQLSFKGPSCTHYLHSHLLGNVVS